MKPSNLWHSLNFSAPHLLLPLSFFLRERGPTCRQPPQAREGEDQGHQAQEAQRDRWHHSEPATASEKADSQVALQGGDRLNLLNPLVARAVLFRLISLVFLGFIVFLVCQSSLPTACLVLLPNRLGRAPLIVARSPGLLNLCHLLSMFQALCLVFLASESFV